MWVTQQNEFEEELVDQLMSRGDAETMKTWLEGEALHQSKLQSETCRARKCTDCNLMNSKTSTKDRELYKKLWDNVKVIDYQGKKRISCKYEYKDGNMMEPESRFIGIGISTDGGLPAYGSVGHILSQDKTTLKQDTNMIGSSSKISKRAIPAHEALSKPNGMELGKKIVECIAIDPEMI